MFSRMRAHTHKYRHTYKHTTRAQLGHPSRYLTGRAAMSLIEANQADPQKVTGRSVADLLMGLLAAQVGF